MSGSALDLSESFRVAEGVVEEPRAVRGLLERGLILRA